MSIWSSIRHEDHVLAYDLERGEGEDPNYSGVYVDPSVAVDVAVTGFHDKIRFSLWGPVDPPHGPHECLMLDRVAARRLRDDLTSAINHIDAQEARDTEREKA